MRLEDWIKSSNAFKHSIPQEKPRNERLKNKLFNDDEVEKYILVNSYLYLKEFLNF